MSARQLTDYRTKLTWLFTQVPSSSSDPEVLSHWARYITVLVSGFLEASIPSILQAYAQNKAAPYVVSFVSGRLDGVTNLNAEKIGQLLGAFDSSWQNSYLEFLSDERKQAINSVVGLRNVIAHGRDTGVTLGSIRRYYSKCDEVVSFIESLCKP